jgi:hypothetical protein
MVAVIHDARCAAIEAAAPPYWWRCGVLFEPLDTADYLKTDPRSCGGTSVCGLGYPLWRAQHFTDALRCAATCHSPGEIACGQRL